MRHSRTVHEASGAALRASLPMLAAAVLLAGARPSAAAEREPAAPARLIVKADEGKETIHRNIFGHFAEHLGGCIYGGIWVGEESPIPNVRGIRKDVVEALRRIKVPVLRWPGGCFADEYHWKDGIGPRDRRPSMVNTHWGGVTENNHFGTHEFFDLCEQLGCEPYICGNAGSGTVQEMQEWVEYITFDGQSPMSDLRRKNGRAQPWKVKYWSVGNENWGCGGNMRPEYYADIYRRYATYLRNFGGNRLFKVACGSHGDNYAWTEVLMREAGRYTQGLAYHYYCGSGKRRRPAAEFGEEDWFAQMERALRMDELLTKHGAIMDRYDTEKRVALLVDEWGAWHEVEPGTNPGFLYQQNTLHDALVASATLDIFVKHAGRVKMANIAQTVNVLQAMVLTKGERMVLTPTFHVFEMYTVHHDAKMLPVEVECRRAGPEEDRIPVLSACASRDAAGKVHISLSNLDPREPCEVVCEVRGAPARKAGGRILTAGEINAHNTFEVPVAVEPAAFEGARIKDGAIEAVLPAKSVVVLEVE